MSAYKNSNIPAFMSIVTDVKDENIFYRKGNQSKCYLNICQFYKICTIHFIDKTICSSLFSTRFLYYMYVYNAQIHLIVLCKLKQGFICPVMLHFYSIVRWVTDLYLHRFAFKVKT